MDIIENRAAWREAFENGWLKKFHETGETDWSIYSRPDNKIQPSGKGIDLSQSRLMLISTAGGYLKDSQTPFDAPNLLGDYTIRAFPSSTPLDALAYAHEHYDHVLVDEDPQVLVPLRHLEDLVNEGVIGELAPTVVSYSGYQPDLGRIEDELIPEVVRVAKEEAVRAALLVPA